MRRRINVATILLICFCLVLTMAFTGCSPVQEKEKDPAIEEAPKTETPDDAVTDAGSDDNASIIEPTAKADQGKDKDDEIDETNDGDISINVKIHDSPGEKVLLQTGRKAQWPGDLPGHVPQFDGVIFQVLHTNEAGVEGYSIGYKDLKTLEMNKYVQDLESLGWKVLVKQDMGDSWMINADYQEDLKMTMSVNLERKAALQIITITSGK